MADAKKCDRCNGYYDNYSGLQLRDDSNFYYAGMSLVTSGQIRKSFDLCPDCMSKLISFIKQGEKQC